MMSYTFPNRLRPGDEVRVVSPARSLSIIDKDTIKYAYEKLSELGFVITYGKHASEKDQFNSSSIESRVEDIHDAFSDENVKGILTVIGGLNSNQLLQHLDWELIKNNPKVFCGFSDITVLNAAMLAKSNLVTFSGPHYSSFGMKKHFDYTLEYFKKCLMEENLPYEIHPSTHWSDDAWFLDQDNRNQIINDYPRVHNEGIASGPLIGGNLSALNLLHGTPYMPSLTDSILFIEDDAERKPQYFDRDLTSLIQQNDFSGIRGIVMGRFQKRSEIDMTTLHKLLSTKIELKNVPIITNVDFGHTSPIATLPIGGTVKIIASTEKSVITIMEHIG